MIGRKIGILFLMIAQIVLLGHEFVPHHHHDHVEIDYHHHEHNDQDHHHHQEDSPLQMALSLLAHAGEQVTFTCTSTSKMVLKDIQLSSKDTDFLGCSLFLNPTVTHLKHTYPPDRDIVYLPPIFSAHSLRGPPFLNVV